MPNPETNNISHAAAVLPVVNITESLAFYTQKLGFECSFSYGEPISYAVLKAGSVSIHLTVKEDLSVPSNTHTRMYIFVHNIQQIYEQFIKAGVATLNSPTRHEYGMTDFDLKDPDGYILSFGSAH